jgi:hypothetical protein
MYLKITILKQETQKHGTFTKTKGKSKDKKIFGMLEFTILYDLGLK